MYQWIPRIQMPDGYRHMGDTFALKGEFVVLRAAAACTLQPE